MWVDEHGLRHRAGQVYLWWIPWDGLRHYMWQAWSPDGVLLAEGRSERWPAARSEVDAVLKKASSTAPKLQVR